MTRPSDILPPSLAPRGLSCAEVTTSIAIADAELKEIAERIRARAQDADA